MKVTVSWHRGEPDTYNGYKLIVTQVYSSFDITDIDKLAELMRKTYGDLSAPIESKGGEWE